MQPDHAVGGPGLSSGAQGRLSLRKWSPRWSEPGKAEGDRSVSEAGQSCKGLEAGKDAQGTGAWQRIRMAADPGVGGKWRADSRKVSTYQIMQVP